MLRLDYEDVRIIGFEVDFNGVSMVWLVAFKPLTIYRDLTGHSW